MGYAEFIDVTTSRCPMVLLVDTSVHISPKSMTSLFAGIRSFLIRLAEHDVSDTKVESAIITYGEDVQMVQDFMSNDSLSIPAFEAMGQPKLGQSIELGMKLINSRAKFYERHNIDYHKPWLFLISSGKVADDLVLQKSSLSAQEADLSSKLSFFIVGTATADMEKLRDIASPFNPPLQMKEDSFESLFNWLGASMRRIHEMQTGAGYLASPIVAYWAKGNNP